jgi:hypothetical protein
MAKKFKTAKHVFDNARINIANCDILRLCVSSSDTEIQDGGKAKPEVLTSSYVLKIETKFRKRTFNQQRKELTELKL